MARAARPDRELVVKLRAQWEALGETIEAIEALEAQSTASRTSRKVVALAPQEEEPVDEVALVRARKLLDRHRQKGQR